MRPTPLSKRLGRRELDLKLIRRAAAEIAEINDRLDREPDAPEQARMRELRGATGQIVRLANDASQAYRRVGQAMKAEIAAGGDDAEALKRTLADVRRARAALLNELERASRRYPWANPWPEDPATGATRPQAR